MTPRWFAAIYRAVLRAAPEDFRERYGREALNVAARRVSDRPRRWQLSAALGELTDLAAAIGREWRAARRPDRPTAERTPRHAGAGDMIFQDLRSAYRSLRASPGFTVVALVILTLGIGASTAIFSVVDAVVLRGLPFDEGDRIMQAGHVSAATFVPQIETPQGFFDLRDAQDVFESVAATSNTTLTLSAVGDAQPEKLSTTQVMGDLFRLLRVQPAIGRAFTSEDDVDGRDQVAVISDRLWHRQFGADPKVVGRMLRTADRVLEIVGVMPPGFAYPLDMIRLTDVWTPYAPTATDRVHGRGRRFAWLVVGRLKPGVSIGQASAEMQQIGTHADKAFPGWYSGYAEMGRRSSTRIDVLPLGDAIVSRVRSWMLLLLGTVAVVLLIACVNVANLMLARATGRERELAVRAALGGTRWRLAQALIIESLLLSSIGTALGVLIAYWGVAVLKASMPVAVPRFASIAIDTRVLAAAVMMATATGLLFGLAPALRASREDLTHALKQGARASAGRASQRLRGALVVAEVTLAVILLVGAGLFISSFVRFMTTDLGFDDKNVLTAAAYIDIRSPTWQTSGRQFVTDAVGRLEAIPGVQAAAAVADEMLPLVGGFSRAGVAIPGRPDFTSAEELNQQKITPDYFKVLGIALLRGRIFNTTDTPASPPVVVINDAAEKSYFDGRDAIGQAMTIEGATFTVVGVVRGVRLGGPETDVLPQGYLPVSQSQVRGGSFVIRTSGDPAVFAPAMRAAIREANPGFISNDIRPLESYFAALVAQRKFNMQLLGLFGLLGIAIAGVGIYGVMAYIVSQQTEEIGVRIALGALPSHILRAVLARATLYVGTGLAIGIGGAWLLSRFAAAFLFHVQPHAPIVYVAVAVVLVSSGLVAAIIPARRAASVDPVVALRAQ